MPVELIMQGGSITLDESEKFNKWRHRLNKAKKMMIDYENGNIDGVTKASKEHNQPSQVFEPFHVLTAKTEGGGRVSIDPAKFIAMTSDEAKDVGVADDDWDDDDEDEDDE